jgi:hypothetical protein
MNNQNTPLSKDQLLAIEVENEILSVAELSDEVTHSDLQGLASVAARKIIAKVREHLESTSN